MLQWALAEYKTYHKKYVSSMEGELKRLNLMHFNGIADEILEYNYIKGTDLSFDDRLYPITSVDIIHRLKENNFAEYYIGIQN